MKVCFELAAAVREKSGVSRWELESVKPQLSVREALEALETAFSEKHLTITEGRTARKDILVFLKKPEGKQMRLLNPEETVYDTGDIILLASAMGGG